MTSNVVLQIGNVRRTRSEATPAWITRQLRRRQRDGVPICVRVRVTCCNINVTLTTPSCSSRRGGRRPNADEQRIFDLWEERGLNEPAFGRGNLIAFLRQLDQLIGSC